MIGRSAADETDADVRFIEVAKMAVKFEQANPRKGDIFSGVREVIPQKVGQANFIWCMCCVGFL